MAPPIELSYIGLKHAHVSFVIVSYLLFVFRGAFAVRGTYQPTRFWNLLIHGVDTMLLLCGVSLAIWLSLNPWVTPWLMVKLIALVLYVLLAALLVRRGRTRTIRLAAYVVAQLIFLYMVLVAISHNPLVFI